MLKISNLHVNVDNKEILKGIDLEIAPGEVHAIMGPNGSGKSTLSYVLAGREGYEITQGSIEFDGRDLCALNIEERAAAGVFLAMQYPVAIPGISNLYFLRAAYNSIRKVRGENEQSAAQFMKYAREKAKLVELQPELLKRAVNDGFSGGEKKRNEIFQMALLEPKLCILDETDSGLDIDALRIVSEGVNALRTQTRSMLVITHYQRLLNHIVPDVIHVLVDGKIVQKGGHELALALENEGYETVRALAASQAGV